MAQTFALDPGAPVMQQPVQTPGGVGTQISGGGQTNTTQAHAPQAMGSDFGAAANANLRTLDALNKLTDGLVTPYVQKEQKRLYYEGMSQVIQGKSLKQVEDEQPWWSKIFGPSATVQGAQAMTATTAVAQAQSQFLEALPDLKSQTPDDVRQWLVSQATNLGNTGDPLVDGLVQSKLAEAWPSMLDMHMRQHLAWQQEDVGNKWVNASVSQGVVLQNRLRALQGHELNSNDARAQADDARAEYLATLQRPYGMDDDSYGKWLTKAISAQLPLGNFSAYEAAKGNGEIWNRLPIEARTQLESQEDYWTQKHLAKQPQYNPLDTNLTGLQLALSQGTGPATIAEIDQQVDRMNASWRAQSGSSTDMVDNKGRQQLYEMWARGQAKLEAQQEKAANDLLDDQAQRTAVRSAVNAGTAVLPDGVKPANSDLEMEQIVQEARQAAAGDDKDAIDTAWGKLAQASFDPRLRAPSLVAQLKQDTASLFATGGAITPRSFQSLRYMQLLTSSKGGGPLALANYIGSDNAAKVLSLLKTGVNLNDPKELDTARKVINDGAGAAPSKEEIDAASDFLTKQGPGKVWQRLLGMTGTMHEYRLSDESLNAMTPALAAQMARIQRAYPGITQDEATQLAFGMTYGNQATADFFGGTIIPHNPWLSGAQSLYAGVNSQIGGGVSQATQTYQQAVSQTISGALTYQVQKAAEADAKLHSGDKSYVPMDMKNFDARDYHVIGGEQLGGGVVHVSLMNKSGDGRVYTVMLTPQDVARNYRQVLKDEQARVQRLRTAPPGTEAQQPQAAHGMNYDERNARLRRLLNQ